MPVFPLGSVPFSSIARIPSIFRTLSRMQEHRSAPLYFVVLLSVLANAALRCSKVLVSLDAIELGDSAFTIGVIAALFAVFPLLLAVQAGRISDRIGVRRPILLGAICMSAGLALPAVFRGLATLFPCPPLIGLGHLFLHGSTHNAIGSRPRVPHARPD